MADKDEGQEDLHVCVYSYALRGDLPPEAVDELRRAHELRNDLVAIERRHEERKAEIWANNPELAAQIARTDELDELVEAAEEQGRSARGKNRSTDVGAEQRAAIKALRKERSQAKVALRELKKTYYPAMKEAFSGASQERKAEIKALYAPYMEAGLYWATFNDVREHHDTAVKSVAAKRTEGQPAEMKFHGWTGEGTLRVQLQRGAGVEARTPTVLADPEKNRWKNVFSIQPVLDPDEHAKMTKAEQRRAARQGTIRFRIGSYDAATIIEMPVILHRPLPLDADVPFARITRRRVAGRYRNELTVTVRLPAVPKRIEGTVAAAHIGWRALPDGALRVAVIAGDLGPTPEKLNRYVRRHDGWAEVVITPRLRSRMTRMQDVQSQRDVNLDMARAQLVHWLRDHPVEGLEHVDKWRSPARFASLARRWDSEPPEDGEEITAALEAWRVQDRHLWEWRTGETDRVLKHRREIFRLVAAWLTETAAAVVVDEWKIDARRPAVEQVDERQERLARANRMLASPGDFRSRVQIAAKMRGVTVLPAPPSSRSHSTCGTYFDDAEKRDSIMVWCSKCQVLVDQDADAALKLLRTVTG